MPDNRPFSQWDLSPIPVIAFAPGSHSVLYRNSAAMPLAPDTLVEGLTGPESAALCAALDAPMRLLSSCMWAAVSTACCPSLAAAR